MEDPRIIIIEPDEAYAELLEYRFTEAYGDRIQLHTITDRDFFNTFFTQLRTADAVLIDESLYTETLKRHKVKSVFVLCEGEGKYPFSDPKITCLNKYSSIKAILNEVTQGFSDRLKMTDDSGAGSKLVTVFSGIGGSGKTTVALALAEALSENHKKVLYICTEDIQSFGGMVGERAHLPLAACQLLQKEQPGLYQKLKGYLQKNNSFSFLPSMMTSPSSMQIRMQGYLQLLREAKESGDYDVILADPGLGTGESAAKLLEISDQAVVLLLPDELSRTKTDVLFRSLSLRGEKYIFAENRCMEGTDSGMDSRANIRIKEVTPHRYTALAMEAGLKELAYLLL